MMFRSARGIKFELLSFTGLHLLQLLRHLCGIDVFANPMGTSQYLGPPRMSHRTQFLVTYNIYIYNSALCWQFTAGFNSLERRQI